MKYVEDLSVEFLSSVQGTVLVESWSRDLYAIPYVLKNFLIFCLYKRLIQTGNGTVIILHSGSNLWKNITIYARL